MATTPNPGGRGAATIQWLYALRGDFADRAFKHPGFTSCVGDGNVMLSDMTDDELQQAIRSPAAALDVVFEEGLIKRIIEEVRPPALFP